MNGKLLPFRRKPKPARFYCECGATYIETPPDSPATFTSLRCALCPPETAANEGESEK